MRKTATTFLFVLFCVAASAQRQHVVADMDTRLPLQGAVVATSGGQRLVTDYSGRFHSTLPVTSATVSKKNYMQRRVGAAELQQDTIYLIPQEVVLKEVEVTTPGFSFDTKKALSKEMENAKFNQQVAQGGNLLGLLTLLLPSSKAKGITRAEKIKKVLEKY